MNIRSDSELVNFLGVSSKNRKQELISFRQELINGKSKNAKRTRRTAVVIAYAHWEGFVKDAARAYVSLVAHKSRKLSDLIVNFQALALRQELMAASNAAQRILPHINVATVFTNGLEQSFSLNPESAIHTGSNLTSEVFENICLCVGLDFASGWSIRGPFINDLFLNRCTIAHGEFYDPTDNYAIETVDFALASIDQFATEIQNAAIQRAYLRATSHTV